MEGSKKFNRAIFCDEYGDNSLIFMDDIYDDAIIGVSTNGNVIYNGMFMVELMMNDDHTLSWVDAMKHYNHTLVNGTINSDSVNKKPILMNLK